MSAVPQLVEHLFRHESGRITAALTRALGSRHLALAEEATQEALIRALQTWPFRGLPADPAAWLFTAARNYARDQLRRHTAWLAREPQLRQFLDARAPVDHAPHALDDTLAMMLLCAHPAIPADARAALILKTVSGFSTREIAAAFLTAEETVAQRIVRAKRLIRDQNLPFELPRGGELDARLDTVCEVLYLLFNEGYFSSSGAAALRRDLCDEAVRLLGCLFAAGHANPARHALAAIFHLHLARFDARTGAAGELLDFEAIVAAPPVQRHIELAAASLAEAMRAGVLTPWHLEAAIAAEHCRPHRDWTQLVKLYDALLALTPSPLVRLNRAVAVFRSGARAAALAELEALEKQEGLRGYSLLAATQARLHEEAGNHEDAKRAYRRALACQMSEPARVLLTNRLARLES